MKFAEAEADELPLVFDSWARSFQKSPWAGCIPNHMYPSVARAAAAEIIDRGARILVACVELEGDQRRVMGYSVSEPDRRILHWLFVKKDYRGTGLYVGRQLLAATCAATPGRHADDEEWVYTYRTRASSRFLGPSFRWAPELARIKG